uniref:MICOS complex subunit MIC13 n=1 Tax=Plectus sambesii TaxID=2011161 RepID=A0A914VU67_9BILA
MGKMWKLTYNAARVGLLAGAVKLSVDQGVWSTGTDKTSVLFEQVKSKILPGTIVYPEKLPKPQEVKENLETNWNCGVKTTFDAIEEGPSKIAAAIYPPTMSS